MDAATGATNWAQGPFTVQVAGTTEEAGSNGTTALIYSPPPCSPVCFNPAFALGGNPVGGPAAIGTDKVVYGDDTGTVSVIDTGGTTI